MGMCIDLPDLHLPQPSLSVLLQVHVDWKMSVDVSHLVLVALCHADDHVVDDGADCAEGCGALAAAMVHFNEDKVFLRV